MPAILMENGKVIAFKKEFSGDCKELFDKLSLVARILSLREASKCTMKMCPDNPEPFCNHHFVRLDMENGQCEHRVIFVHISQFILISDAGDL